MQLTEIRTDPRPVAIARIGVGIAAILNSLEAYKILSGVASGRARCACVRHPVTHTSVAPPDRCPRRGRSSRRHHRVEDRVDGERVGRGQCDISPVGPADIQQPPTARHSAHDVSDLRESRNCLVDSAGSGPPLHRVVAAASHDEPAVGVLPLRRTQQDEPCLHLRRAALQLGLDRAALVVLHPRGDGHRGGRARDRRRSMVSRPAPGSQSYSDSACTCPSSC